MPPAVFSIDFSVKNAVLFKCYLSIIYIPPAVCITGKSIICKVYFTILDIPPAVLVFCQTRIGKIYLTSADVPPAVFVIGNTVVVKIHKAFFHTPPAIAVVCNACIGIIRGTINGIDPLPCFGIIDDIFLWNDRIFIRTAIDRTVRVHGIDQSADRICTGISIGFQANRILKVRHCGLRTGSILSIYRQPRLLITVQSILQPGSSDTIGSWRRAWHTAVPIIAIDPSISRSRYIRINPPCGKTSSVLYIVFAPAVHIISITNRCNVKFIQRYLTDIPDQPCRFFCTGRCPTGATLVFHIRAVYHSCSIP